MVGGGLGTLSKLVLLSSCFVYQLGVGGSFWAIFGTHDSQQKHSVQHPLLLLSPLPSLLPLLSLAQHPCCHCHYPCRTHILPLCFCYPCHYCHRPLRCHSPLCCPPLLSLSPLPSARTIFTYVVKMGEHILQWVLHADPNSYNISYRGMQLLSTSTYLPLAKVGRLCYIGRYSRFTRFTLLLTHRLSCRSPQTSCNENR